VSADASNALRCYEEYRFFSHTGYVLAAKCLEVELNAIAESLNTRPRKKLGFFTPEEIYLANLSHYTSESNVALQS